MSTQSSVRILADLLGERLGGPPPALAGVNWPQVMDLARRNRVAALAQAALAGRSDVPPETQRELLALARRSFVETTLTAHALNELAATLRPTPWALLRGPALGSLLYGDLMLRPYGDLDVLVAPDRVDVALHALNGVGFELPPGSLNPRYYRAYHLHLALERPGLAGPLRVELHWALDHPFSLTTVDVPGMLTRARPVLVEGVTMPAPAPDDLLLTLALHTVKHAVRLPLWVELGAVDRVAEDECLLPLLDVALLAQTSGAQLDWGAAAMRAERWGAASAVRACLEAVEALWPGQTSQETRMKFASRPVGRAQQAVYGRLAPGRAGLFRLRRGAFFRPVRLLDAVGFVFAPADYLRRRYGATGLRIRFGHALRALARLAVGGLALAYFSLSQALTSKRHDRPRIRPALPVD